MVLDCLPYGLFSSNCYIVGKNNEGIIIDPGCDPDKIMEVVQKRNLSIKYIIITHGHIDHMISTEEIRKRTGADVLIHEDDAEMLINSELNDALGFGMGKICKKADRLLQDGDIIEVGGISFEIIHTPGHSRGCICIKAGKTVFTGDTLFKMGVGRTDLPGGNTSILLNSIKTKLLTLGDDVIVYPGHGASTTIGTEKTRF
ncbi:MAG: MBL fold metallo-hydrolase [Clostridium sp.]|nr:MBL fold metallo-hydrolase [Clostridium sp.]